jgi:hypothetical protein
VLKVSNPTAANVTPGSPELVAKARKIPIRILVENGIVVALIRAVTEAAAIRYYTKKIYEAPIADQDHLIQYGAKFPVEDASAEPE